MPISKEKFFTGQDNISTDVIDFLKDNSNHAYSFADLSSILSLQENDLYWILSDLQTKGYVESKIIKDKVYYILNP